MAADESEWPLGPDGIPERHASRVVLISPDGRLYLMKGHDTDDDDHAWWFTIGGGRDPGESARDCAVRETWEETALKLSPEILEGPVLHRTAIFHFAARDRRQFEDYFLARLTEDQAMQLDEWNPTGLTELERDVLDGAAWLSPDEIDQLSAAGETFYPIGLAHMARTWIVGWDGSVPRVNER